MVLRVGTESSILQSPWRTGSYIMGSGVGGGQWRSMEKDRKEMLKMVTVRDFPGGPVVRTSPSNAGGAGSLPGRGAEIPHASGPKNQKLKQKQYCNKFNKDLK